MLSVVTYCPGPGPTDGDGGRISTPAWVPRLLLSPPPRHRDDGAWSGVWTDLAFFFWARTSSVDVTCFVRAHLMRRKTLTSCNLTLRLVSMRRIALLLSGLCTNAGPPHVSEIYFKAQLARGHVTVIPATGLSPFSGRGLCPRRT